MTDPSREVETSDIWKAYEAAQKHYDADFTLFTNRMNLFLVVESALIALAVGALTRGVGPGTASVQQAISIFGLLLSVAWFAAAAGSYRWVKVWRRHMVSLGEVWEARTGVTPSAAIFSRDRRSAARRGDNDNLLLYPGSYEWYIRPTLIACGLPVLYSGAWIYVGLI